MTSFTVLRAGPPLPRNALKQALGYLDEQETSAHETLQTPVIAGHEVRFIKKAMLSIGERLHALRIALVARSSSIGPDLLLSQRASSTPAQVSRSFRSSLTR